MSSPAPRPPPPRSEPTAPRPIATSASPNMYRSQSKPVTIPRAPPGARPRLKARKDPPPPPVDEDTMQNPMAAKAVTFVAKLWRGVRERRRLRTQALLHFYNNKMFVRIQCAARCAAARLELRKRKAAYQAKLAARNQEHTEHVVRELQHVWHWERSKMLKAAVTIQAVYRWHRAMLAHKAKIADMDDEAADAEEPPAFPLAAKKKSYALRSGTAVDRPWAPRECIATTQTAETALVVHEVKPTRRKPKELDAAKEVIPYGEVMWFNNRMREKEAAKEAEKADARERAETINQGALVSQDMDECAAIVQRRFRIHRAKGDISSRKVLHDYQYEKARTVQCAVRSYFSRETLKRLAYGANNRAAAKTRQYSRMMVERIEADILWNRHELERAAITLQRSWRWADFDGEDHSQRPPAPPYGLLEDTRSHSPSKKAKKGSADGGDDAAPPAAIEDSPSTTTTKAARAPGPAPTRLDVSDRLSSVSRLVATNDEADADSAVLTVSSAGSVALQHFGADVWVLDPEEAESEIVDAYIELLADGRLALFTKEQSSDKFVEGWTSEPVDEVSHCVVVALDDGAAIDVIRADGSIGWSTRDARIEKDDGDEEETATPAAAAKEEEKPAAPEEPTKLQLVVTIVKATNVQTSGEAAADTYCVARLGEQKFQTPVVDDKENPVWNAETTFDVADPEADELVLRLWDEDTFSDDRLASATVKLSTARLVDGTFVPVTVRMIKDEEDDEGGRCDVHVELKAIGFSTEVPAEEPESKKDDATDDEPADDKDQSASFSVDRKEEETKPTAPAEEKQEDPAKDAAGPEDDGDQSASFSVGKAPDATSEEPAPAAATEDEEQARRDRAATRIQSVQRQRMAKADVESRREKAAAAISAGNVAEGASAPASTNDAGVADEQARRDKAATRIQSVQRQRMAKADVESRREKPAEADEEESPVSNDDTKMADAVEEGQHAKDGDKDEPATGSAPADDEKNDVAAENESAAVAESDEPTSTKDNESTPAAEEPANGAKDESTEAAPAAAEKKKDDEEATAPAKPEKLQLIVKIVKATGVTESSEVPDSYCVARLGEQKFQTPVVADKENPVWNAETTFDVADPEADELVLRLWDEDTFSDDRLASAKLKLAYTGLVDGETMTRKVRMHKEEDPQGGRCDVYVELTAVGFSTKKVD